MTEVKKDDGPVPETEPIDKVIGDFQKGSRAYTLRYKHRGILKDENFVFAGNLSEAVDRARRYCSVMRYKFVYVNPFFVNLDEMEERFKRLEVG